ncbi:hypothetical protein [Plantactinospora sp. B5E13]|uniref:hypothetical protein n=1 Tax=unclassified Plantactinospora TaxID=2631981 RepID=UPI00325EAE33
MLRFVNELGDRMLAFLVPRATAAAADCGSPRYNVKVCMSGWEHYCRCWSNSNCRCDNCTRTTHAC